MNPQHEPSTLAPVTHFLFLRFFCMSKAIMTFDMILTSLLPHFCVHNTVFLLDQLLLHNSCFDFLISADVGFLRMWYFGFTSTSYISCFPTSVVIKGGCNNPLATVLFYGVLIRHSWSFVLKRFRIDSEFGYLLALANYVKLLFLRVGSVKLRLIFCWLLVPTLWCLHCCCKSSFHWIRLPFRSLIYNQSSSMNRNVPRFGLNNFAERMEIPVRWQENREDNNASCKKMHMSNKA